MASSMINLRWSTCYKDVNNQRLIPPYPSDWSGLMENILRFPREHVQMAGIDWKVKILDDMERLWNLRTTWLNFWLLSSSVNFGTIVHGNSNQLSNDYFEKDRIWIYHHLPYVFTTSPLYIIYIYMQLLPTSRRKIGKENTSCSSLVSKFSLQDRSVAIELQQQARSYLEASACLGGPMFYQFPTPWCLWMLVVYIVNPKNVG